MRTLVFLSALLLSFGAAAQPKYEPQVGQAGKDVIWVPTPDDVVDRMLTMAQTGPNDIHYDLGAGDGKIAIAAAKQFNARAMGIEYNKDMAALAKRNAERAGVADRVTIVEGDVFKEDFSKATVVTMYLLPDLNLRLRPTLLATFKVGFVLTGHILAVIAAHDRAVRVLPERSQVSGQLAMLVLMLFYTVGGLLLLFNA